MATLTQKERIAAAEASQQGHRREHELGDRAWAAKLDAIDARIRGVERILLELRLPNAEPGGPPKKTQAKRDVSLMGGSAALTSLLWILVEFASELLAG